MVSVCALRGVPRMISHGRNSPRLTMPYRRRSMAGHFSAAGTSSARGASQSREDRCSVTLAILPRPAHTGAPRRQQRGCASGQKSRRSPQRGGAGLLVLLVLASAWGVVSITGDGPVSALACTSQILHCPRTQVPAGRYRIVGSNGTSEQATATITISSSTRLQRARHRSPGGARRERSGYCRRLREARQVTRLTQSPRSDSN